MNTVIHSMKGEIIAKTDSGRYIIKPDDTNDYEFVPFETIHKCIFPNKMLDEKGLLKDGTTLELVRVSNGWLYPNHKIYKPSII